MGSLWWVAKATLHPTARAQACAPLASPFPIYVVTKEGMGHKNGMEAAVVGADYLNLQKAQKVALSE